MEFELKTGPQGHVYLPKIVRKTFGESIILIPNSIAGAIFRKDANPDDVITSLETIISSLRITQRAASQNSKVLEENK